MIVGGGLGSITGLEPHLLKAAVRGEGIHNKLLFSGSATSHIQK